ncbi:transmembrane protein 180-like [Mizuhopecten yessoensis]|uniref:Transmembrane protein 180 n=1 Tax=Mizuhopecten yessoensis TaxID=6573 RepID=A0A210Q9D7_MIZYE|nr:transmembrane protein 180-like [Mizuhopecten yessoensis]OWF45357.1 Transmembrane protein 180 [Mizuhopecten yessoensis]
MTSLRCRLVGRVECYYGSMAFFQTIIHNIFLLYHVDLFVSVYKIDKMSFWVGETIFLIWNSLNDPLFGWLSDKQYLSRSNNHSEPPSSALEVVTNRLNALMYTGPLMAVSFVLFWFPWGYPGLQFAVCLCLYDGFLTMVDLHHSSLLADLAVSAKERTQLNTMSSFFSAIGSASVFFSYSVWSKENLSSFRIFCLCLAVFAFLGFFIAANLMKHERTRSLKKSFSYDDSWSSRSDSYDGPGQAVKPGIVTFVSQLSKQRNFIWFTLMNLIQVFHCHFNSNFFPLFLENLLGNSVSSSFGSFLIGISFLAPHVNNLFFLELCKRYGVYTVIQILFSIKLALSLFMFFMGPNNLWLLCLFIASNRVFTEGTCKLLNLVISDLVDEDYVLHNRKRAVSALIFGSTALLSKPGQTLAPLIGMWLLAMQTGHDIFQTSNKIVSLQLGDGEVGPSAHEQYRQGCFNLLVYIPILCAVVQIAVWSQFKLHGHRLRWVKSCRTGTDHSLI